MKSSSIYTTKKKLRSIRTLICISLAGSTQTTLYCHHPRLIRVLKYIQYNIIRITSHVIMYVCNIIFHYLIYTNLHLRLAYETGMQLSFYLLNII